MNRLLVFALVAAVGNASVAFAEEGLLSSGARHVQQIAVAESASTAASAPSATLPAGATVVTTLGKKPTPMFQAQQGDRTLSRSGMSKGMKAIIYIGLGVGVAAGMYAIDHHVVDITPSSLGTRKD